MAVSLNDSSCSVLAENVSPGFVFQEINGDLFSCAETDSLVHCVSKDLRMGKGIAVEFKKRFGNVESLKRQQKEIGQVASLKLRVLDENQKFHNRFVYYMITKKRYCDKPTLSAMETTLQYLRDQVISDGVQDLSMPILGCGLDRLNWPDVKALLIQIFKNTNIRIKVYRI